MDPTTIATPDITTMLFDVIKKIGGGQYVLIAAPILWALVAVIKMSWKKWLTDEKIKPWLPLIAMVAGAASGAASALTTNVQPAAVVAATIAGAALGLGVTGTDQLVTKLWTLISPKKKEEVKFLDEAKLRYRSGSLALDSSGNIKVN